MNKKLSARTRALVSACLQNSSDDEDENYSGVGKYIIILFSVIVLTSNDFIL